MKSVILIAVRMKSTRLPKKALAEIEGKTVIEHLIARLRAAKVPDSIILCTSTHPDDRVLLDIARKNGIKSFAGSEDDVLLRFIGAAEKEGAEVAVRVTGDNPLTDPGYIDRMLEQHIKTGAEYTYTEGLPEGTKAEVMSVSALKKCRELSHNPEMSEYMTLYFRDSGKFKVSKIVADEGVDRPSYRLTIDTPQDLELLRGIYRKLGKGGSFSLQEVVRLLDSDPSLAGMNAGVKPKDVRLEIEGGKMRIVERA